MGTSSQSLNRELASIFESMYRRITRQLRSRLGDRMGDFWHLAQIYFPIGFSSLEALELKLDEVKSVRSAGIMANRFEAAISDMADKIATKLATEVKNGCVSQ